MGTEHLPSHHVSHAKLSLRHIANVSSPWIHNDIFVGLLKSEHNIHELQLPGHDYGGVRKYTRSRMPFVEYAIRIFRYVDRGEEVVCLGVLIS